MSKRRLLAAIAAFALMFGGFAADVDRGATHNRQTAVVEAAVCDWCTPQQ